MSAWVHCDLKSALPVCASAQLPAYAAMAYAHLRNSTVDEFALRFALAAPFRCIKLGKRHGPSNHERTQGPREPQHPRRYRFLCRAPPDAFVGGAVFLRG